MDDCDDVPDEFFAFIRYAQSLEYGVRPNYARLRDLFRRLFKARGFKYDLVFDWTEKKFHELAQSRGGLPRAAAEGRPQSETRRQ